MTRRRHWLLGCAIALLIAIGAVAWIVTRPQPNLSDAVRQAIMDRVGKAVSIDELTILVGVPPGDYSKGNRNALLENLITLGDDATAIQIFQKSLYPGRRSSDAYQSIQSAVCEDCQIVSWWGRKNSLVVICDDRQIVRGIAIIPWIRGTPSTFAEKCEDWIYTQVYGKY